MIAKKFRLSRNEIDYLLKKGDLKKTKLFLIKHSKKDENYSSYCVIISRKISNKAVTRNKLKRQIMEAIRILNKEGIEPKKSLNIALIPKKNILKATYQDIQDDIENFLKN